MERVYGAKYDRALSTKEIAAKFREDVKDAKKHKTLPAALKLSVRYKSFSGGSSIDVTIMALPAGVRVLAGDFRDRAYGDRYSDALRAVMATLKGMLGAYNHDGSDTQSDYFDVRFYGDVSVDWELERAEREAAKAAAETETSVFQHGSGIAIVIDLTK